MYRSPTNGKKKELNTTTIIARAEIGGEDSVKKWRTGKEIILIQYQSSVISLPLARKKPIQGKGRRKKNKKRGKRKVQDSTSVDVTYNNNLIVSEDDRGKYIKKTSNSSILSEFKKLKSKYTREFLKYIEYNSKEFLNATKRYRKISNMIFEYEETTGNFTNRYTTERWSLSNIFVDSFLSQFNCLSVKKEFFKWGEKLYSISYDGKSNDIFNSKESFNGYLMNPPFINYDLHLAFHYIIAKERNICSVLIGPYRPKSIWFKWAEQNLFMCILDKKINFLRNGVLNIGTAPERTIILFMGLKKATINIENKSNGFFYLKEFQKIAFRNRMIEFSERQKTQPE